MVSINKEFLLQIYKCIIISSGRTISQRQLFFYFRYKAKFSRSSLMTIRKSEISIFNSLVVLDTMPLSNSKCPSNMGLKKHDFTKLLLKIEVIFFGADPSNLSTIILSIGLSVMLL